MRNAVLVLLSNDTRLSSKIFMLCLLSPLAKFYNCFYDDHEIWCYKSKLWLRQQLRECHDDDFFIVVLSDAL